MIVPSEQQRDSYTHTHVSTLLPTSLPCRLGQNVEQNSLGYALGPHSLPILNIAVCLSPSQTPQLPLPPGKHKFVFLSLCLSFYFLKNIYLAAPGLSCPKSLIFVDTCSLLSWGMWDLIPWPGIQPGPLHWELRILASGPPGKFPAPLHSPAEGPGALLSRGESFPGS